MDTTKGKRYGPDANIYYPILGGNVKNSALIFLLTAGLIVITANQVFAEKQQEPAISQHTSDQSNTERALPFSLTISGGISLGSYEAGINWALIDFMKSLREDKDYQGRRPELNSITGASAGAINAVMTAMLWCVDKDEFTKLDKQELLAGDTVNDNIIRNAWLAVGIDELMPPKDSNKYCDPGSMHTHCGDAAAKMTPETKLADEMFARSAFGKSVAMIKELLKRRVFKKELISIDIALLATRETPVEIQRNGINVKNQRYVFLLQFETDGAGGGHFKSRKVDKIDSNLGTVVYLPQKAVSHDSRHVDPDDVIRLMYASSAFPVAFGKVNLTYCTDEHENSLDNPGECPEGTYSASAAFIDGGVFDNIPLGAALALRKARIRQDMPEARYAEIKSRAAKTFFFFINPSNRRNVPNKFKDPIWKKPQTYGIKGMLGFMPGFIAAASDHELYTVLRSGDWKSYRDTDTADSIRFNLVATDRYFPITGAYLGHFGAFLDRPFREFDYNAGVYDIVNGLSSFMCIAGEYNGKGEDCAKGSGKLAEYIYKKLDIKQGDGVSEVFYLIAKQEHAAESNDPNSGWRWINDQLPEKPGAMYTVFDSIIATSAVPLADDEDKTFGGFIRNLHASNYVAQSQAMKWMINKSDEDSAVWYTPLIRRAGERLRTLQALESRTIKNSDAKFMINTAVLGLDRYFNYNENTFYLPNSVPENGQASCPLVKCNAYPYELGADTGNGGLYISYLGRINYPSPNYSIDLKLTPVGYSKYGDNRIGYSQADLYLSFNRLFNGVSAGIGPTYDYLWKKTDQLNQATIGTSIYVELLQTVRITVGLRDYTAEHMFGHNYYWTFGLVDIPGIFAHW